MRLALPPWLDALRPSQLAKNALVLAGFFFALPDRHQAGIDPLAAGIRTLAAERISGNRDYSAFVSVAVRPDGLDEKLK